MYTYRNTRTGIEFSTTTECAGEHIELIKSDAPKQEETKPKAKATKGKK